MSESRAVPSSQVCVVVGNPKPKSRTRGVAEAVAAAAAAHTLAVEVHLRPLLVEIAASVRR